MNYDAMSTYELYQLAQVWIRRISGDQEKLAASKRTLGGIEVALSGRPDVNVVAEEYNRRLAGKEDRHDHS